MRQEVAPQPAHVARLREVRCPTLGCGDLLFKESMQKGIVEIRCRKCKTTVSIER